MFSDLKVDFSTALCGFTLWLELLELQSSQTAAQSSPWLHGLRFHRFYLAGEPHDNSSLFKVGLSIKVGSFQVADPVLIRGVQQEDISWDGLITLQLNKISH